MSGKCRPSLRKKALMVVKQSDFSQAVKECIAEVFERYERIVLCKDCLNNNGEEGICDNIYCTLHKGWFDKDAFCSYGEKALKEREK